MQVLLSVQAVALLLEVVLSLSFTPPSRTEKGVLYKENGRVILAVRERPTSFLIRVVFIIGFTMPSIKKEEVIEGLSKDKVVRQEGGTTTPRIQEV